MIYMLAALFFSIIVLVGAIKLVAAIFSFIREHIGIGIAIFCAIGGIIYYIQTERFLASWQIWRDKIRSSFWKVTYGNTFLDTLWLYAMITGIGCLAVAVVFKVIKSNMARALVCMLFVALSLAAHLFSWQEKRSMVIMAEILAGAVVLWRYRIGAGSKIGLVKDVNKTFTVLQKFMFQASLTALIVAAGTVESFNDVFDTSISNFVVPVAMLAAFVVLEWNKAAHTFKAYRFVNKFVKEHGFFHYKDFSGDEKLAYLTDPQEYVASVVAIMMEKNRIYALFPGKQWYLNQMLEKAFERSIKANLSSEEIREKVNTDFREFTFETVYQVLFARVKGYEIDFAESEESKSRRISQTDVGATEFVIMRYPIECHPVLSENTAVRGAYVSALNYLVNRGEIDRDKWNAKIEEYRKVFKAEEIQEDGEGAVKTFSETVIRKEGFLKRVKTDYSYLLLLEAIYFENLMTEGAITYQEIESTFEKLKIKRVHRDFIYQYIKSMFIEGDVAKAEKLIRSKVNNKVRRVLEQVHDNIMWNERYVASRQLKVAVCATMSAGKSTFINSMLGTDYIPAKNEACTAKVTTIRDNDNLSKLIGCYTRTDGSKVYSNIIDGGLLSIWNEDTEVVETILEGNIEEVCCDDGVLVIHDTPGTNNSEDISHHDKTIEFIKSNDLNVIIYLINAEHISTTDTEILLLEIQGIVKHRDVRIVFGLNKIDAYDEEGNESVADAVNGLCEQLRSYGFESPVIFPFSANAARLFKMVIKGGELTKREKRAFASLFARFSNFNASSYAVNAEIRCDSAFYPAIKKDKKIVVEEKEYSYNEIVAALGHTGIFNIENWMETQMKNMV